MIAPSKSYRRPATFAAVCVIALLSGCSLAPLYERPAAPIPASYPVSTTSLPNQPAQENEAASAIRSTAWCTQFPDPVLRRLVVAALEHNRNLKLAAARVVEARALHGVQSASRLPTVALEATTTHPARNNESAHQAGVTLAAYELDFFGKAQSLSDAALHEYLATELAQRAARISVVAEVVRGYVLERAAAARVELAQRAVASRTAAVALLTRRVAADTDLIEQQLVHARADHALALLTGYGERTGTKDAPPFTSPAFGAGWGVARPSSFLPQPKATPLDWTAREWLPPAVMAMTLE